MFRYPLIWCDCRFFVPATVIRKKLTVKTACTSHLPLRRSLRLAQPRNTTMADAMDDVVQNTQNSVSASTQERVVEERLRDGGGRSVSKPSAVMPKDTHKRPNASSPVKVPSCMCISHVAKCCTYHSLLLIIRVLDVLGVLGVILGLGFCVHAQGIGILCTEVLCSNA